MSEYAQQVGSLPAVESLREEPMVREELWREMHRLFSERRWSKSAIAREQELEFHRPHGAFNFGHRSARLLCVQPIST